MVNCIALHRGVSFAPPPLTDINRVEKLKKPCQYTNDSLLVKTQ